MTNTYVIGIKKKMYASENEIEWKYATVRPAPADELRASWGAFGDACAFRSISEATDFWKMNGEVLISEPGVLPETVCIRRAMAKTEALLSPDVMSPAQEEGLERIMKEIESEFNEAESLLGGRLFRKKFLKRVSEFIEFINSFEEGSENLSSKKSPEASETESARSREQSAEDEPHRKDAENGDEKLRELISMFEKSACRRFFEE